MERTHVSNYGLSGTIIVGGVVFYADKTCNNGVYKSFTNYYENNPLELDNRTALHPTNVYINNNYINFTPVQMGFNSAYTCSILLKNVDFYYIKVFFWVQIQHLI
jgi:hypothetical protein